MVWFLILMGITLSWILLGYLSMIIYEVLYAWCLRYKSRLTVVSREAKKKQHTCASSGPRDHYSELFTRMAALKF